MLPEALLSHLKSHLAEQMGLSFAGSGWRDFEQRINAAARDAGVRDTARYIDQLLTQPLSPSEIGRLAGHLTVGETYFFREKRSFDALANHLLPELLRKRELAQRRLRIWSAGCCTGEETYSIAILLDRLLPVQDGWDISILGTDINPLFLQKARRAVYSEWSFRGTPNWVRQEYFTRKRNGTFELLPKIRDRVRFSELNLAQDQYPSPVNHTDCLDAIFCRNVLMYFAERQASHVVERFRAALREDGLLLVSPAETSSTLFSGFSLVNYPGAIFYRLNPPAQERSTPRSPAVPFRTRGATRQVAGAASRQTPARKPTVPAPVAKEDHPSDASRLATEARRCADEGLLDQAEQWCAQAIAADKLNPAFHYLHATIEQERGMIQPAIQALQRALFLDQDFVLAHFALANLRLIEGRRKDAGRHLDTVRELLADHPEYEALPESDGLTAGRLLEIAASLRAGLAEPTQITAVYG